MADLTLLSGYTIDDDWLKTPGGAYSLQTIRGVSRRTRSVPPMPVKWAVSIVFLVLASVGTALILAIPVSIALYGWCISERYEVVLHTTGGDIIPAYFEPDYFYFRREVAEKKAAALCALVQDSLTGKRAT